MKYIIPAILCAFLVATFTFAQGTGTINQLDQWRRTVTGQITQNIASSTIKLTGYESSGYCLVTDINGVVSTSSCGTGGGGGASSTVIKINGTVSNTGVPTIDFGSGITVTESPTDEFNLSVPIYLATSSTWTTGNLARVASNGAVDSLATSALAIALSDTTGTLGPTRGGTNQTTYTTGDMLYASAANMLSKLAIGSTGNVLIVQGGIPTWVATSSLGITSGGTPGGGNLQLQFNNAGTFGGTSSPSVTSINATSTSATSTLPNIIAQKIQALSSAGLQLFSNAGAVIVDLGAGGGTNATFYGGVNIDGQTRLATSLTGLLRADSGVVSAQSTSTLGLIGGSGTVGNVAFFNTATTLQSVATGTLTETATGLSLSGSPLVLGGSSVLTIDSGFTLASTTGITNLYGFYDTPSSRITAGTGLSWSGNTLNGQPIGFASSSPFTTGDLVFAANAGRLNTVATGTLTENVTGLELSATQALVGGAAILNLTSGFVIPTSTLWTSVADFYTTPSTRITAGANCSWAGNTFNCEGGGGGGGSLSTTTDIVGDGAAATVSYVTTDVMFGGSASTSAEFQFDKDGSKLIISSSSASASTTIANTNTSNAIQMGIASSTQYASPLSRGIQWLFRSTSDVILSAVGGVTNLVVQMHFYLASGYNFFVGSTQWNNGNFIEGAAIASSTINATSLKAGTATAGYYLAASSTASGGMSWIQLLVNLANDVTGVLGTANGGTATTTVDFGPGGTFSYTNDWYIDGVWLKNATVVTTSTFALPATGGTADIYTVPAGKRAIYMAGHSVLNYTGGTVQTYPYVKPTGSSTAYRLSSTAINNNNAMTNTFINSMVLEPGDIFGISVPIGAQGATYLAEFVVFDDDTRFFSSRVFSQTTATTTLYTAPTGYSSILYTSAAGRSAVNAAVMHANDSGSATNRKLYFVPNGQSANASTSLNYTGTTQTNGSAGTSNVPDGLSAGDSVQYVLDNAGSPQVLWVNVFEKPN